MLGCKAPREGAHAAPWYRQFAQKIACVSTSGPYAVPSGCSFSLHLSLLVEGRAHEPVPSGAPCHSWFALKHRRFGVLWAGADFPDQKHRGHHQQAFADWGEVFPNATWVVSLVDRLVHRPEVVRIEGESYRAKEAQERLAAREKQRGKAAASGMTSREVGAPPLPAHWSPEQALAVFECLHWLREQLWAMYGPAAQPAWIAQLAPRSPLPEVDPNDPFGRLS